MRVPYQASWAWGAVVALGALVLLPGLGDSGLWDPWEMRVSHVGRTVTGPPRIFVAESPETDAGDLRWPLTAAVQSRAPAADVHGPAAFLPTTQVERQKTTAALVRTHGATALRQDVFHGILLDARLWARDLSDAEGLGGLAVELDRVDAANAGSSIALAWPGFAEEEAALRDALLAARIKALHAEWSERLGGLETLDDAALARATEALRSEPLLAGAPFTLIRGSGDEPAWQAWLDELPSPWARIQFKRDGVTRTLPPLDAWLLGASYTLFGFSETASRLPFALLALLGAVLIFWGFRPLLGAAPAFVASLVLLTSPMYFAQGRFVSGAVSATVALALFAVGYARCVLSPHPRGWWLAIASSAVLLTLADGLFALVSPLAVMVGYLFVGRDFRRRAWLPPAVWAITLAAATALVLWSDSWSYLHHFRFTRRLFTDGPTPGARTFDSLLRQVGFGMMPWSALFPFALGWLAIGLDRGATGDGAALAAHRARTFVLLSAVLPLMLFMMAASELNHLLFPAVPAVALAIGLFATAAWESAAGRGGESGGPHLDRLSAFAVFCILYILLREVREYGDAAFGFLAVDPPFDKSKGAVLAFPPDFKTPMSYRALGFVALLALVNQYAHLGTLCWRWGRVLMRPGAPWVGLTLVLLAVGARWLMGAADAFGELPAAPASRELGTSPAAFVARALSRPEQIALAAAAGIFLLRALAVGTGWSEPLRARCPRWARRASAFAARAGARLASSPLGALVALGTGLALLATALFRLERPPGFGMGTTFADPLFWGLVALTLGVIPARRWGARQENAPGIRSTVAQWTRRSPAWVQLSLAFGALAGYTGLRISKELWVVLPEHWTLASLLALVLVATSLVHLPRTSFLPHLAVGLTLWMAYVGGALASLYGRWVELGAAMAPASDAPNPMRDAFLHSRVSLAGYAALAVLLAWLAVRAWRTRRPTPPSPRVLAALTWLERAIGWLERPRPSTAVFATAALGMALLYSHSLVASMSYHVSQKHILDTYTQATADPTASPLFSHGQFGGGDEDYNFYTNNVPRISDRDTALKALARREDMAVRAMRRTATDDGVRIIAGWSEDNDRDQDGVRDWASDSGLASAFADGVLTDETKAWEPDRWRGHVLLDSRGKTFPITGNSATTLRVDGRPTLEGGVTTSGGRYAIDHPDAANHAATLDRKARTFFMLPKRNLSELNHAFRKQADGMHIPILDDRSSRMVLAASWLTPGEVSANPIDAQTYTEAEFAALSGLHRVSANFEDKLEIVAYRLEEETVRRRGAMRLHTFFKVLAPLPKSYKIFMHIDKQGSSHRIHGDHFVLNQAHKGEDDDDKCVGCFQTSHWLPGDIIEDIYEREIPLGTPSGNHDLWMGFFEDGGGKRLKVKEFDKSTVKHDGDNRISIGLLRIQ